MMKINFKIAIIGLLGAVFINTALAQADYQLDLPVGIPDPLSTWTTEDYQGKSEDIVHPITGVSPVSWVAAKNAGDPAYYIDNTSPNATNKNNEFGSPDLPRLSIPETTYEAGSYVEIHGGPYSGGGQIIFTAKGTPDKPVWIKGASFENMPEVTGETIIKGQYVFLENLKYTEIYESIQLRNHNSSMLHHVVIRNNIMKGTGAVAGRNASAIIAYGYSDNRFHDIVIYNNDISYFGNSYSEDDPEAGITAENDYHGIGIPSNVDRAWVLNNHIHHMGGDSIQVGTASTNDKNRVENIYIGGNDFHNNLENGVDVKEANNTLISTNKIYNFQIHKNNFSTGVAVVVHNGAYNTWLINNHIYNSGSAIEHTEGLDLWVVGNVIDSIQHPIWSGWDTESVYSRGAAVHVRGVSTGGILNNTINNVDKGITLATAGAFQVSNNSISNRNEETGYDIHIESSNSEHVISNNLVYTPDFKVNFKNVICDNCLFIEPSFINENYEITNSAAGVASGVSLVTVQNKFKNSFGVELNKDILGQERVKGTVDIGAIENQSSDAINNVIIESPVAPSIDEIILLNIE